MTEDQGSGATKPNTGSEGNDDDAIIERQNQSVGYESYRKVLGEKKKETAKRRELEQRLAEIEAEKEAQREMELKEQGRFKDLLADEQTKRKTLENELNSYKKTIDNSFKFNAIKKTLGAEIDYKWADYLDMKGIYDQVELDDNRTPDEMSVTKVCDYIRKEFPEMIATNNSRGNLPNDPPQGVTQLSYDEWLTLPADEMKKRIKEVIKE